MKSILSRYSNQANLIYPLIRMGTDAFVVGFAVWTVAAHVVVWFNLPFEALYKLGYLPLIAIPIWFVSFGSNNPNTPIALRSTAKSDLSPGLRLTFVGIAALLSGAFLYLPYYSLIWLLTVLFLLISWVVHGKVRSWSPKLTPGVEHLWEWGLILLAVMLALGTIIFVNRFDEDDSLYLNMAVSVLDHPNSPIFAKDTLQNIPGGNYLPTYRVHTFELLVAALARLTAATPISIAHFWLSLLAAALSVLAVARLMLLLLPKGGAAATLLVVCILLVLRNTHWIYGNFAFVRLFQGKSWFVTIGVPLIIVYALEYVSQPDRRRWLLLALIQTASIGLTANALYAAPITAGLTLCCCWQPGRTASIRLLKGVSASVYPVFMGLLVYGTMQAMDLNTTSVGPEFPVEAAFQGFFGAGAAGWLWLFTLLGGWAWVQDEGLRRWALTYSTFAVGVFLSPFWDEYLTRYVTGSHLIWRLFWTVPLPVFMALWLTYAFLRTTDRRLVARYALRLGLGVMLAVVIMTSPQGGTQINVSTHPIILKVPYENYRIAQEIVRRAKQPSVVLAPANVSPWITTFSNHPYPLVARPLYILGLRQVFQSHIDVRDLDSRLELFWYISGQQRPSNAVELLRTSLRQYSLQIVVVQRSNPWTAEIKDVFGSEGFCSEQYLDYEFFEKDEHCASTLAAGENRLNEF